MTIEGTGSGLSAAQQAEFERQLRAAGIELFETSPIVARPRADYEALSFAQERLWLLDQIQPGDAAYNVATAVQLRGRLDVPALRRSLDEVVRRHEVLRTTIEVDPGAGTPAQRVHEPEPVGLSVVEVPAGKDWRLLAAVAAAEPFDLSVGPLLRAELLRHDDQWHTLLLTIHHVVVDGWSMGLLVNELNRLYDAAHLGRTPSLPPLALQYADYAAWQREWISGDRLGTQLDYWRTQLSGLPALSLPAERCGPATPGSGGAQQVFRMPEQLTAGVTELCRQEGVTTFMVLMAAFQAVLAQRSGQHDFGVGTPVAGRPRPELEGLIGFFVNTLVLRADLSGTPTFRQLLRRVRGTALAAWEHQDVPFERLVQEVAAHRDLDGTPLFRVMFALQNAPAVPVRLAGLDTTVEAVDTGASMFDILLTIEENTSGGFTGTLAYRSELLSAADIGRLVDHFQELLGRAVDEPDQPLGALAEPRGAERAVLLRFGNLRTSAPTALPSLVELFERQADAIPERPAVIHETARLTYRELDQRANQLAHHLRKLGTGPDAVVAVCLDRTSDLVSTILGVLKAGAAYLPLDPEHPPARLAAFLADAHAEVLVTTTGNLPAVNASVLPRLVLLDQNEEQDYQQAVPRPRRAAAAADLAYIRYTSGSTGRPKGVAVTTSNLAHFVAAAGPALSLDSNTRFLARSNVTFDATVAELLTPLCYGGTTLLVASDQARDPWAMATIMRNGCTHVQATPSLWQAVVDELPGTAPGVTILTVGEALPGRLAAALRAAGDRVLNFYGPTETTVYATGTEVTAAQQEQPTIGTPYGDTFLAVLDPHLRLVRQGVAGELHIGGPGVARGYVGQPVETALRFVPDPFSVQPGARLYRSGDLVRWRDDGTLEFLGRADEQIKIRGIRVEPAEIRAAILRHEDVVDAAVVAAGGTGDISLTAYVVPVGGTAVDVRTLRRHLAGLLPAPLVPAVFVQLPALPLTTSGKLDRAALPAPGRPAPSHGGGEPQTPEQSRLAALWTELLDVPAMGVNDDFFALGGHSLLAARLVARIRQSFGVDLPLRTVFERPTLEGLAEAIRDADDTRRSHIAIPPADRSQPLALSYAQERLWFLDRLDPGSPAYNIPVAVRLRGPLHNDGIRYALNGVVRRHEALRTTVETQPGTGQPVQRIHAAQPLPIEVVDVPAPQRRAWAATEAVRPFDLARGPLLRTMLLRHADEDHTLLLTVHHIVVDAWSIGVMVTEMAELYDSFIEHRPAALDEPALQYADYATWQRSWLDGERSARQMDYWRRRLAGLPALELPSDHPRSTAPGRGAGTVHFTLPARTTVALRRFCRQHNATLFMALLTAFQTVLWQLSGQRDFAVGTPVAGRDHPELEKVVGFFVNTLVLRADLSGEPTARDLLGRVRDTALEAFEHQDVPFERLVGELQPERRLGQTPLVQVLFGVQNAPGGRAKLTRVDVAVEEVDTRAAKADLAFYFREDGDTVEGDLTYASDLFAPATVHALVEHFSTILDIMLAEPDRPVASMPEPVLPVTPGAAVQHTPTGPEPPIRPSGRAAISALERLFAAAMAGALGLDRVAADDDFFQLGGHSLLAMRLLAQLEDALGIAIPLRRFFESPSPAACADTAMELAADQTLLEQRAELVLEVLFLPDDEVVQMLDSRQLDDSDERAGVDG